MSITLSGELGLDTQVSTTLGSLWKVKMGLPYMGYACFSAFSMQVIH